MATVAELMQRSHAACDEWVARVKAAAGDWPRAAREQASLRRALERHIALEEDVLFPAFEKHSGMYHAGPTRVMRIEHGQLRSLLDVLASATRDRDVNRYLRITDVLSALDREHSTREDRIVYAMIDAALGARAAELIACGALAHAV